MSFFSCWMSWVAPPVRGKPSCSSSGQEFLKKAESRGRAQGKQTTATKPWMQHQQRKCLKSFSFLEVTFNTHENITADKSKIKTQQETSWKGHKIRIWLGMVNKKKTKKKTQTANLSFVGSSGFLMFLKFQNEHRQKMGSYLFIYRTCRNVTLSVPDLPSPLARQYFPKGMK